MAGKLQRANLSTEAYEAVRALVMDGRFPPGAKISVEELTRELGVSRSPVWAAIARLEVEGLVEVMPRQGVFMPRRDPAALADLFVAREALEGMVARLAARKPDMADTRLLERALLDQRSAMEMEDEEAYAEGALVFHQTVMRMGGNAVIERMLQTLYDRTRVLCRGDAAHRPGLLQRWDEHAGLLDAIKARDPDRAEREARAHIRTLAKEAGVAVGTGA